MDCGPTRKNLNPPSPSYGTQKGTRLQADSWRRRRSHLVNTLGPGSLGPTMCVIGHSWKSQHRLNPVFRLHLFLTVEELWQWILAQKAGRSLVTLPISARGRGGSVLNANQFCLSSSPTQRWMTPAHPVLTWCRILSLLGNFIPFDWRCRVNCKVYSFRLKWCMIQPPA